MKVHLSLIALVSAISLPALANTGVTAANNEAGVTTHAMPTVKSRADVLKELATWKHNPANADGWREVGGEAGWVFEGRASTTTRAAVMQELMQAKRDPVSIDGWLDVGGEAGAVYVGIPREASDAHAAALRRSAARQ